jgi:hypothetical protein
VALFRQKLCGGFVPPKCRWWLRSHKTHRWLCFAKNPPWLCSAKIPPLGRALDMPGIPLALISRVTRTYDRRQAQECIG